MYVSRKTKTLNLRIRADLHEQLKEYAAATNQTITNVITTYLEELIREYRTFPEEERLVPAFTALRFELDTNKLDS